MLHSSLPLNLEESDEKRYSEEIEEIEQAAKDQQLERSAFLTQAFAPLNKRIAASRGELIAIRTRLKEPVDWSSDPREVTFYTLEERIQAGIILEHTQINAGVEEKFSSELVSEVRRLYPQTPISASGNAFYTARLMFALPIVYFRDRPPSDGRAPRSLASEQKPRFELYIGDAEAVPFLQSQLKGYEFLNLCRASGRTFLLSPEMEQKIQKEQFELYRDLRGRMYALQNLAQKRDQRLAAIAEQGGEAVFDHGTHLELTDTFAETMRWNPKFQEYQSSLKRALETAKERNYAEEGRVIHIDECPGVRTEIDMKKYFSHVLTTHAALLA